MDLAGAGPRMPEPNPPGLESVAAPQAEVRPPVAASGPAQRESRGVSGSTRSRPGKGVPRRSAGIGNS